MGEYTRFALLVLVITGPLLIVGASVGHTAHVEPEEVIAAVAHDFYPEYMVDADGRPAGFGIDLMNAVTKRAGLKITYRVFETWTDLIAALERGQADLVPIVAVTRAREGRMLFTRPVVMSPASLFVRHDADEIRGWTDLAGRQVAVIEGGSSEEFLSERNPSARLVPYAGLKHALFDLLSGEVDALVSFESSVWKVGERVRLADRIKLVGDPLTGVKRAIAVRRDLPGLRDRLDAAVANFLESLEYRKLYSEWYTAPPSSWNSRRIGWLAGASTALLLLGMLFWQSLSLRAERRQLAASAPGQLAGERAAVTFSTPVISRACGLVAFALGLAVLLGWTFDVAALKTVLPGLVAMQPWAAITLALAGGALLVATVPGRVAAAIFLALAGAALIIGLQMLLQHATGVDFGTDRWFFPEAVSDQPGQPHPGRVAEVTSIAFVLLGAMLLLAHARRAWARGVFSTLGTIGLLLMAAPLLGYLIGAGTLRSVTFVTPIALHTALGLVILFVGVLALRPETGWMAVLSGDTPGATSARMLLPVSVAGPVLFAWLFISGKEAGLYEPDFQIGLVTLATIALLGTALLWNAARLDRLHRAQLAAAEALHESEERFRVAIEAADLGVWDLDLKADTVPKRSLRHDQMFGYAELQPEWSRAICERHVLDEDKPHFREAFARALETGVLTGEVRVRWPDGSVHWISSLGQTYYDEHGEPVRIAGVVADVTERRQAEEALRQSREALETVVNYIPAAVNLIRGSDLRLQLVNPAYQAIAPGKAMVGKTLDELWPESGQDFTALCRRVLKTGEPYHVEDQLNLIHREGDASLEPAYFSWSLHRVRLPGEQGWGLLNTAWETTERKRAEEQLAEQLGLLTAITDSAADAIFVSDGEGRVTLMNPAAERIFGWSLQELTGRKLHDAIHGRRPDGRPYPASECPLTRVYTTGETLAGHEEIFLRRDGSQVSVACSNAPLMIEGRIAGAVLVAHDITERKRAEEGLRESEARLRRTVEYAPFPIMVHAEDGDVVHVSQAWLELTGYAREEIGTIPAWTERAYGERKEVVRGDIDRLYALDQALDEGEYRIRTADGRTLVWAFRSAPLGSDGRGRRLVVSMAADVTERKRAEQALRESELRMHAVLDASQDEILLLSTQGEVLAINRAAKRRLIKRMGGSNPVGAPLDRLLPPDQVAQRMAIVRDVAATARLAHREMPIRARCFEFWFYPVLRPDVPVSEVAVYAREITEQKRALAELSKLFQAIQQSPMSVVITDPNGIIEYVNPAFTQVTGYAPAEVIGRNPRLLKSGHMPSEQYAELWRTISSGGVWRGEFLNKKKNGELFWELASIAPVKDEHGRITHFVAVEENITERKEVEEQLRQSQKMEAVGQLTGGVAHDFNNLLAIILGNLQLLQERVSSDDKAREFLDDALWSARRGADLTHRLLAFARRQPLKPAVIDLNDVVRSITELLRRTLGASIQIEESLAPDLWEAFADRGELERVLVNLAVNSRDAMGNAGTLALETRNAILDKEYAEQYEEVTPGAYALLAVTDTGAGMPPEVLRRAFEPFFTTKGVGQGSGLGLSMVYGFIKQSGGHISIYSRVGQGTCVKLYLPRASSSSVAEDDGPLDKFPEALGNRVVLVVEDEAKLRKVAVTMLDRLGLRSLQAETAQDALALLADTHVDVLFTDIELPGGMNGTELAERARTVDPTIKVLFTTGYAREAVRHERWVEDAVPWLFKPYSHRELARELKALFVPTAP